MVKGKGRRAKAREWLAALSPPMVDEAVAAQMAAALPEATERLRRQVCIESGIPLAPMVEGVRQETLAELERTLLALCGEYDRGDARRRRAVRQIVITSRRHAGMVVRNAKVAEETRELRREMALWMLTWLENPGVFGVWAQIRRRRTGCLTAQNAV